MRYVERNPVRARIVRPAWRYKWSSTAAHTGEADPSDLLDLAAWQRHWTPDRCRQALQESDDEATVAHLRRSTRTGRPLATDRVPSKLEHKDTSRNPPANNNAIAGNDFEDVPVTRCTRKPMNEATPQQKHDSS